MVSEHGYERARERMHLGREDAQRYFRNALERGKSSSDLEGLEREYIRSKEITGADVRFYNSNIYIFNNEGLGITVYPAPQWFGRKIIHRGKEVFRNLSYYRNRYDSEDDDMASAF